MHRRALIPGLILSLMAAASLPSCTNELSVGIADPEFERRDTLQTGGIARTFDVHLPPNYETNDSPVVILLHRTGANGVDMRYLTAFDAEANLFGYLAVYPDATSDWAYGCDCTDAEANGVDDVQFMIDILDVLDADYGIDRDSVFVAGFAEGALMAQRVACEATDTFAGLAAVAGTMPVALAETCTPSRAIPVLMILGTEDENFPWSGAPDLGDESLLGAFDSVDFWAQRNSCGDPSESEYIGTDYYYDFEVYREAYDGCPANGNVVLMRMFRGEHGWPDAQFSASYQIASFFVGESEEAAALATAPPM